MPAESNFIHNQKEYSVAEISSALKKTIEGNFGYVRVKGEISGAKIVSSGHLYFSLKDSDAVLSAVSWKGVVSKLKFSPEDGQEVICMGKITTFAGQSKYQLVVEHMEIAGLGAIMMMIEQRRKKLEQEGLFNLERKKPLPFLPRIIGVVTSPTGAVIRDILHRIADRFPSHVIIWPSLVQGDDAARQIAAGIIGLNNITPKPDLIIVARGGGSIEDLLAFSEEIVVRAAANSQIALISAVGHETDTTLIDFAADKRAPTPTAAAEMAVPVRSELIFAIDNIGLRLDSLLKRFFETKYLVFEKLCKSLPKLDIWLENKNHIFCNIVNKFNNLFDQQLKQKQYQLEIISSALSLARIHRDILNKQEKLEQITLRLQHNLVIKLEKEEKNLSSLTQLLDSYNYQNVLKRGFSIVKDGKNQLVKSAHEVISSRVYKMIFADGEVNIAKLGHSKPHKSSSENQDSLF